jgi:ABC-type transport system substrate-binding protein
LILSWRFCFEGDKTCSFCSLERRPYETESPVFVCALAALVLSACGGWSERPACNSPVGWAGSPDTLNPGMAILVESYTIFELVYDSMYELNLDGSFTLSLAESADVSDDGMVWTFKIRDGSSGMMDSH